MRRLSTITLIVVTLIAMALPASAGKGGNKPPKDPGYKGTCAAAGYDEDTPGHPGDVVTDSFTVTTREHSVSGILQRLVWPFKMCRSRVLPGLIVIARIR